MQNEVHLTNDNDDDWPRNAQLCGVGNAWECNYYRSPVVRVTVEASEGALYSWWSQHSLKYKQLDILWLGNMPHAVGIEDSSGRPTKSNKKKQSFFLLFLQNSFFMLC